LLDVDVESSRKEYSAIDLSQPMKMDRQITLDVLRCHQYHHTLSSPEGQDSLRRVLKAWIITHPELQYWQGLDSICAAFITVTSRDEAVSFGCLKIFVDRFVREFFQSKTSIAMQAHLCIFSQLISFHDPELGKHFKETEFRPEYYGMYISHIYTYIHACIHGL
jgi:TBC domain-containing protein kinase-like protein